MALAKRLRVETPRGVVLVHVLDHGGRYLRGGAPRTQRWRIGELGVQEESRCAYFGTIDKAPVTRP